MAYLKGDLADSYNAEQRQDDELLDDSVERMFRAKQADILLHLSRMRDARLGAAREPERAHTYLGDYYRSMGRVVDLLDDFRIERRAVPAFVQEMWDAERRA